MLFQLCIGVCLKPVEACTAENELKKHHLVRTAYGLLPELERIYQAQGAKQQMKKRQNRQNNVVIGAAVKS